MATRKKLDEYHNKMTKARLVVRFLSCRLLDTQTMHQNVKSHDKQSKNKEKKQTASNNNIMVAGSTQRWQNMLHTKQEDKPLVLTDKDFELTKEIDEEI